MRESLREPPGQAKPFPARTAHINIWLVAFAGIGAVIFGLIVAAKSPTADDGPGAFALLLIGAGCTLFLIAAIAWGVMLGTRAARD